MVYYLDNNQNVFGGRELTGNVFNVDIPSNNSDEAVKKMVVGQIAGYVSYFCFFYLLSSFFFGFQIRVSFFFWYFQNWNFTVEAKKDENDDFVGKIIAMIVLSTE